MKYLTIEARVGKKYAIYLPKKIVKALGIKEGAKVLLRASKGKLIMEFILDPLKLAISGDKFAEINPEDVEAISIEEQKKYVEISS